MRKTRFLIATTLIASAMITPAWAARGGGAPSGATGLQSGIAASSMGRSNLSSSVQQAAMTARQSGQPVGPAVRTAARANSQGPTHANANAVSHVQNSPGQANLNSVLGNGGTTTSTSTSGTGATSTSATATTTTSSTGTTSASSDMSTATPTKAKKSKKH